MLNSIHKKIEAEKNYDKDGKALYKLMNNAVYGKKKIENLAIEKIATKYLTMIT